MDAQKCGSFIGEMRKERGMTQAELAEKLHVTDKAVSRWERGIGFPDIHTLEPLAAALGVSLVELMQAEKAPEATVTKEAASEAVAETIDLSRRRWRRFWKKAAGWAAGVACVIILWSLLTGLTVRSDVYVEDFAILPQREDAMMMKVFVSSSMGFIRSGRDVSQSDDKVVMRFYAAFGGLNSAMGAQNVFVVPLKPACTAIYFERNGKEDLMLVKNVETGAWERVPH